MKLFDKETLQRAARLDDVATKRGFKLTKEGKRLFMKCPFHDDGTASLALEPDKELGVWRCHGCGKGGSVIDFVMLLDNISVGEAFKKLGAEYSLEAKEAPTPERKKVAEFKYVDAAGVHLYTIERWEPGARGRSKDFLQRLANGKPEASKVQVLFHLPDVIAADLVFVVEGEKCAEAIRSIGLCATTHAGGASITEKTWTRAFAEPLTGKRVVVMPDCDEVGRKAMRHVAGVVDKLAKDTRWLDLNVNKKGGDVADWIAAGGTREQLLELAAKAPLPGADTGWKAKLLRTSTNEIKATVGNALDVVDNADEFRGAFWFHAAELAVYSDRALPWDKPSTPMPRQVTDDDPVFGAAWCEKQLKTAIRPEHFGKAIWATARARKRDPLVEWLRSLQWDGMPRIDTWLIRLAGAKDTKFVRAAGKAWLISAVARALKPGSQVDHVLVLESVQGKRKSSMLRCLAGIGGFADSLPDIDGKDCAIILGRTWIVELAELESLRRAEVTQLKAFITRTHDVYRAPYDRTAINVPRRCVFAASTNEDEYLRDQTGNRRWWPVAIANIDMEAVKLQREQLWAEAVACLDAGEPWWFKEDELIEEQRAEAMEREADDPWVTSLAQSIEGYRAITIPEALVRVGVESAKQGPAEARRVATALKHLGWTRRQVRDGGRRMWRYEPPDDRAPGSPPPVTTQGGGRSGSGDTSGDALSRGASPLSPLSPLNPHAGARVRQLSLQERQKSLETTGDSGDSGDARRQTLSPHQSTEFSVSGDSGDSTGAQELADDLWGDR